MPQCFVFSSMHFFKGLPCCLDVNGFHNLLLSSAVESYIEIIESTFRHDAIQCLYAM